MVFGEVGIGTCSEKLCSMPFCNQKCHLKFHSALMELASGDRTGVRNMASKKVTRQKTQGREFLGVKAPFCI